MLTFARTLFALLLVALLTPNLSAQEDSDVLFTVDGQPVTVGEFRYIYGKTNADNADYSRQSVEEYLDLYERFKLKVAQARVMGLDTVVALQQELEGYRRQLAENYLIDRAVTDPLVEAIYERRQRDIEIHHILVAFPGGPGAVAGADTLNYYRRALAIKEGLTPANFATVAREKSEDKYSKSRGGRIGYVTAPFPQGLHALEAALYAAPENKVVGPLRTAAGYHLGMKSATRPARGEVEVGHVLVRTGEGIDDAAALAKIQEAREKLDAGADWRIITAQYSEDGNTKGNGGYLGFFGINRYDPAFETAAFALTKDGQVSDVVKTKAGYHLIRRVSRRADQSLTEARPLLENKLQNDPRTREARAALMGELRSRYGYQFNEQVLNDFLGAQPDSTFFHVRWQPEPAQPTAVVARFANDHQLTIGDFAEYLKKMTRQRMQLGRRSANQDVLGVGREMFGAWLDQRTKDYAESRLEEDFPDFAALMREYREGILLFEATKLEVWDKASEDSTGLQTFFERNRDNYQFDVRYVVNEYVVNTEAGVDALAVLGAARRLDRKAVLEKFPRGVEATSGEYDAEGLTQINGSLQPVAGANSPIINDLNSGRATFYKVERVLPARRKKLSEARGYVIADYQDHLEKIWVDSLRETFPVKVNKRVLNKLIQ